MAEPRVWVQMQVVYPEELGGRIITKRVEATLVETFPGKGAGVEAMIDHVVAQTKAAVRSGQ